MSIVLVLIALVQEPVSRFVFPLPEISGFNRLRYTEQGDYADEIKDAEYGNILWNDRNDVDGYEFDNKLNLYGFRGEDFCIAKPEGTRRVLFVGDSFAEGVGAEDSQTISAVFERKVVESTGTHAPRPCEAMNMGVIGVGFSRYVELVRDGVKLFRPDWVFLIVCANDLPTSSFDPTGLHEFEFRRRNYLTPRLMEITFRQMQGKNLALFYHYRPREPENASEVAPSGMVIAKEMGLPEGLSEKVVDSIGQGTFNPLMVRYREQLYKALTHEDYDSAGEGGGGRGLLDLHRAAMCRGAGEALFGLCAMPLRDERILPPKVGRGRFHAKRQ